MKPRSLILLACLVSPNAFAQFPHQIKNVVVIVQENRTPDNLFHDLAPACPIPANVSGLAACTPAPVTHSCYNIAPCAISNQSGKPVAVPLAPEPLYGSATPGHTHWNFEEMCDPDPVTQQCRNDGAWRVTTPQGGAYGYVENTPVTNSDGSAGHVLDPYLTLARNYGWANYMYQTNQGPATLRISFSSQEHRQLRRRTTRTPLFLPRTSRQAMPDAWRRRMRRAGLSRRLSTHHTKAAPHSPTEQ